MKNLQIEQLQQTDTMIEFRWTDTGSECRVTRDEQVLYTGTETALKDEQLREGEMYTYTIERLNSDGTVAERLKMQTGTEDRSSHTENQLQQIVLTTILSDSRIILAWGDIEGIEEYELYRNGKLLGKVRKSQYVDFPVQMDQTYRYQIRAKRPLERSAEETLGEEKSIVASLFGAFNPKSSSAQAAEEEFWLTKTIGRLDKLLGEKEEPKGAPHYPVWHLRYSTFLPDKLLTNPNLTSLHRYFEGDNRSFDPNSKRYRTHVSFSVHLNEEATLFDYKKDVGTSIAYNWRKKFQKAGVGSADGISLKQVDENDRKASVTLTHSVGNPLTTSPNIDYDVYATFYRNGHYDIVGVHDQAPNHEVYLKKGDDGEWNPIHQAESKGLAWMSRTIASQYWRTSNFE